jgi:DNA-binding LytR/AlgR family response regulator
MQLRATRPRVAPRRITQVRPSAPEAPEQRPHPATLGAVSASPGGQPALNVLVVDDERPALAELVWLLGEDRRVGQVRAASSAEEALVALNAGGIDVVFCDIQMPGLSGIDLARVLSHFAQRPQVVFVTAYDTHAVAAFEVQATDYVMKPVRAERLREAVRRVLEGGSEPAPSEPDETIAVELGGVTRLVARSSVRFVEAQGDYVRLHTADTSHLLRASLSTLEERWRPVGFVRIHRSTLVALHHVDEVRVDGGRWTVRLGDDVLQVSRRHARDLRDSLEQPRRATP